MLFHYTRNYWVSVYRNNGDFMYNNLRIEIEEYLKKYPPALWIYEMLIQAGDVYVMGGLLREYKDKDKIVELRDADFTIDIKNRKVWDELLRRVPHKRNHFGGYKFLCSGFIIDIWDVKKTWAFEKQVIKVENNNYFEYLSKSVFLNLDAIIYDLTNDKWNDLIYQNAVKNGELEIVLRENPFKELNILRAMVLREKYNMRYSEELAKMILDCSAEDTFLKDIMEIQEGRYGYIILSKEKIKQEVENARRCI